MGVIETVKDVAFLVQKVDNIEVVKRVLELQDQVYALVDENRKLKDEIRDLKERLTTREQMEFRKNSYWKGEDGPYCPRCFDAEALAVRMLVRKGYHPKCPKCDTVAADPDSPPASPIRVRSGYLDRGRDRERF